MAITWPTSAVASAKGLGMSVQFDLPTGFLIVCMFGFALMLAGSVSHRYPVPQADSPGG